MLVSRSVVRSPDSSRLGVGVPGGSSVQMARKYAVRSSGNLSCTGAATWTVLDSGLNLTFANAQVGDIIEANLTAAWLSTGADNGFLDFATNVSAAAVNYFSSGSGTPDAFGIPSCQGRASAGGPAVATAIPYTLQSGDISGGSVTISLMGMQTTAVNKTLQGAGATNGRVRITVVHLRPT